MAQKAFYGRTNWFADHQGIARKRAREKSEEPSGRDSLQLTPMYEYLGAMMGTSFREAIPNRGMRSGRRKGRGVHYWGPEPYRRNIGQHRMGLGGRTRGSWRG